MLLYGLLIFAILYGGLYVLYSINYVGGTVLYDSPITQLLFPFIKDRLYPIWGFNPLGMMNSDSTKHGAGEFWLKNEQGFVPTKEASGGLDPSGGMREVDPQPDVELRDGYDPIPTIRNIYDDSSIPSTKKVDVGWWGY